MSVVVTSGAIRGTTQLIDATLAASMLALVTRIHRGGFARTASNPRMQPTTGAHRAQHLLPPWSSPNVVCYFDHAFELVPLFVERQGIAMMGTGEAALRRQA